MQVPHNIESILYSDCSPRTVPFPDDRKHIPPVALDELVLIRTRGMKVKPVKARIDEPLCELRVHFRVTGEIVVQK